MNLERTLMASKGNAGNQKKIDPLQQEILSSPLFVSTGMEFGMLTTRQTQSWPWLPGHLGSFVDASRSHRIQT